nr:hypothetical protein [Burkholderia thailandensis]
MKRLDPTTVEFRDSCAADLRPGAQRFFAQAGTNGHISVTKPPPDRPRDTRGAPFSVVQSGRLLAGAAGFSTRGGCVDLVSSVRIADRGLHRIESHWRSS